MTRFLRISGPAAPLPEANVDTDVIFPARFLLITARDGLGPYAFHDRRFTEDGAEIPTFVLNREPWRNASILIAGANFGCGSSREQAVWALLGQGIRCVIAPSFGEIFHANSLRNRVLPVNLPEEQVATLLAAAERGEIFALDLETSEITFGNAPPLGFTIPEEQRQALLNGWDETAMILNYHGPAISAFEVRQCHQQPWLWEHTP